MVNNMKKNKILISVFLSLILSLSICFAQKDTLKHTEKPDIRTIDTKVADILSEMPVKNTTHLNMLLDEIVSMGPDGIKQFTKLIVPPGKGDDTKVRYALGSLAKYVTRSGAEQERKMCSEAFLEALKKASDKEVKVFFIQQLQIAGKDESVTPLRKFLKDNRLCEPATQALLSIKSPMAEQVLLKALSSSKGANQITIVKALGELKSEPAIKKLLKYQDTSDKNLRKVTLFALANIADPATEEILARAAEKAGYIYEETEAVQSFLLFARRLGEKGNIRQCDLICRNLMRISTSEQQTHTRIAALGVLVDIKKEEILKDLVSVMDDKNKVYRKAALQFASSIPGENATAEWIRKIQEVTPESQAEIIEMLGNREDKAALKAVLNALKSNEKIVRLAAIPAAGKLGKNVTIDTLLEIMKNNDNEAINIVKKVFLSMPGEQLIEKAAGKLPEMPSRAKGAIIEVIAARKANSYIKLVFEETKNKDKYVSKAAFLALENLVSDKDLGKLMNILMEIEDREEIQAVQRAIVAAAEYTEEKDKVSNILLKHLEKIKGFERSKILTILPEIGGKDALQTIAEEFEKKDGDLKKAAFTALVSWNDIGAADVLYKICKNTENDEYAYAAFEGYVRQVSKIPVPDEQKLLLLKKINPLAKNNLNKKLLLKELGNIKTFQALIYAGKYLNDPDLSQVACRSVMSIALPQTDKEDGIVGKTVADLLQKVKNIIKGDESENDRERINKYIEEMPDEEGFVPLFNGKDLGGWKGLVGNPVSRAGMHPDTLTFKQAAADKIMRETWTVRDGVLWFSGHGSSLCTVKDYSNFELLVDCKIEKNGDSGIYLRGSPQVQIWDTSRTESGAYVGSGGLYNNKIHRSTPLKVADNPLGEWNTFRIKMTGERVTVYLNGELVVDNEIMENYWERNKPIYPSEQIELQAHGTNLWFRDIYIKELPGIINNQLTEDEKTEGFVTLFNGMNLDGWIGNKIDYLVEDGTIVIYPDKGGHGNLYTEKEYSDFVFRFEFQLTSGANNGLGIRAPSTGDAAYVGMELQILDNTASIYENLKEYQYHGSVYGVIPAKRGYLKPVGDWNYQEVIAKGPNIKVILNGTIILDGNIYEASKNGTIDGREHPGLRRAKGYIGFLGHGSLVRFRNIRIKDLAE
jgi:HEAT repeat protein